MEATVPLSFSDTYEWIAWLFLVFSIICVGFFSSSEAALMSVNKIKIKHLAKKGNKRASAVERVVKHHDKLFGTILTTENLFIIFASSLGTTLAIKYFGERGIVIATIIMTVFIVIFGEITPKTYAAKNSETVSLRVGRIMEIIIKVLSPVISCFTLFSNQIIKFLGGHKDNKEHVLTPDEIKTVFNLAEEEGILDSNQRDLLERVFDFAETQAKDVMVPRIEMVCIRKEALLSEILDLIKKTGHSRIPVYHGDLDNIVGLLHVKDLLGICFGDNCKDIKAEKIMRPPYFAPASQMISKLLNELKLEYASTAILVDEFGGTAGFITVEQLLEVIVGEIDDEYDKGKMEYIQELNKGVWLVNARASIEDINEKLEINLPEGEYNTLAGFVIHQTGQIPEQGEQFEYNGIKFIINKTSATNILQIKIIKGS